MSPRRISPASVVRLLGVWRGERGGPAYGQLADSLRLLILDGRLALDVVLPGERELATALEVSRTTVTTAFARLRDDGFLERRQGAGARTRLPAGPGERGCCSSPPSPRCCSRPHRPKPHRPRLPCRALAWFCRSSSSPHVSHASRSAALWRAAAASSATP